MWPSKSAGNRKKKEDFPEALPVFNFCQVMNEIHIFFYLHPRCHGNCDISTTILHILFLLYVSMVTNTDLVLYILKCLFFLR